jgi:nicotinamide-nucleotide amidase
MRAEIVSIGTEIMLGEIVDTNAAFIASQLPEFGIDLLYVSQVGDNPGRLQEVLARAWERSELTLVSGGLGPTEDDVTREAAAAVLGEKVHVDDEQRILLEKRFGARSSDLVKRNMKQAWLIPSASAISNPRGTAPGWWVERDDHVLVLMPGPPAEMTFMWEQQIAPKLEERASSILVSHTLKTAGLGESTVDQMLDDLLDGMNPSIGIYARRDGVHVRLSAKADTREQAWRLIHPLDKQVRNILGPHIWGEDEDTLAAGIGRLLRNRSLTLAVMESATGGAIGSAITDVAGSSDYFKGSLVTYVTPAKVAHGVPAEVPEMHGVISRETAEAMAQAAREQLGADLGIGLTGIAGSEEIEGQSPGTMHIALTDGERSEYQTYSYYQGRDAAKRRATTVALDLLRRYLLDSTEIS